MENKIMGRKTKIEIIEERKKWNGFNQYILKRYREKGIIAIKSSQGLDELDILLGIKTSSKFDDEDKKYLSEGQLKELVILEKFD
jgi:hypothetical protein